MTEEKKEENVASDNKKKMLLALAIAAGASAKSFEDLAEKQITEANKQYAEKGLKEDVETDEPISPQDIQQNVAKSIPSKLFKIVNPDDGKACDACKKWIGKIVSTDKTGGYPTVDDFINSNGLHIGCRCSLQPIDVKEMPRKRRNMNSKQTAKELSKLAMNSKEITDLVVYRGFVDLKFDPEILYDWKDTTLVMIAPKGEFIGSDSQGNPTKEIVDDEALKAMAAQEEELLLDKDHASMRPIGVRDSSAYGWISGLKALTGLGDMDGLYGLIKWTEQGLKLAKERVYRFLSPVFELDSNGKVTKLVNVALTNRPALKMPPIINSLSEDSTISITDSKKDTDDMNKDEIKEMITTMIKEALDSKQAESANSEAEEKKAEETAEASDKVENEEAKEEAKEEKTEVANEDVHVDMIAKNPEDVKVDLIENSLEKAVEKTEEVISKDVLNSVAAKVVDSQPWKNLSGKAFWDWMKSHPKGM